MPVRHVPLKQYFSHCNSSVVHVLRDCTSVCEAHCAHTHVVSKETLTAKAILYSSRRMVSLCTEALCVNNDTYCGSSIVHVSSGRYFLVHGSTLCLKARIV